MLRHRVESLKNTFLQNTAFPAMSAILCLTLSAAMAWSCFSLNVCYISERAPSADESGGLRAGLLAKASENKSTSLPLGTRFVLAANCNSNHAIHDVSLTVMRHYRMGDKLESRWVPFSPIRFFVCDYILWVMSLKSNWNLLSHESQQKT